DINLKEFGKNVASPKASIEMMNRFRTENSLRALARQGLKGPGIVPLLFWAPLDAKYPGAGFQEVANSLHELRIGNGEAIDLGQNMKALGSVSEETRGLIIGYYFVMSGQAKFSSSDSSLPARLVTRRQGEGLLCPPALEKTKITGLADDTVVLLLERRVDLKRLQKSSTEFRNLTTIKSRG
ncbi:MAG: hypothetical protein PHH14_06515, partial [Candidatus Margulisbacteria bacterium]|nr:hypothetical protein [Candidatus Margulisiibacteriota bacterium]